jgi:hypothetical protein
LGVTPSAAAGNWLLVCGCVHSQFGLPTWVDAVAPDPLAVLKPLEHNGFHGLAPHVHPPAQQGA